MNSKNLQPVGIFDTHNVERRHGEAGLRGKQRMNITTMTIRDVKV